MSIGFFGRRLETMTSRLSRVYASLPLSGPQGALGRDVLRGAELALERADGAAPGLVALDSFGADREAEALANQVMETAPLLGEAGLLQVAPAATYIELSGPTLVRLMPHDGVGARAIAAWLVDAGVRDLLVVHDHDQQYGVPVGEMCAQAARERGLAVRSRPVWDRGEPRDADLDGAEAVLYVGVAGSGAVALWHDLHAAKPGLWLLGTEGVAVPWLARELSPSAAARTRLFVAQRAPFAFYGFEAMALILDAVASAGADRAAIARAARAARDRDSILGRYSIDEHGHTTSTAYGRLAVVGGEMVWDRS